jgi:glycosyltransferase involved in cell wall biosynthesis
MQVNEISQIIIVEGGSTDDTLKEAHQLARENSALIQVTRQYGRGKFDAVRHASQLCDRSLIIIWDADGTVPLSSVKDLVASALNSGNAIIGNRLRGKIEKDAMRKANYIGNWLFAILWAPLLQGKVVDLLCGTKIFTKEVYESIPDRVARHDPYGDFSLLLSARLCGLKIDSLPVHYLKRQYGVTNIKRWSGGIRLIKVTLFAYSYLWKIRKNQINE